MIVLGLTGSMAMGKSTITQMLRHTFHIPVWDVDEVVRELLATDRELINEIAKLYPEVMVKDTIDRSLLRSRAFEDADCLTALEHLIHGRAFSKAVDFLAKMQRLRVPFCALDVPLLFEVGWDKVCTHTIVVYAPESVQKQRLMRRPDLNDAKIEHILSRQWDLSKKKAVATYEIQTGLSKRNTFHQIDHIIKEIKIKQNQHA